MLITPGFFFCTLSHFMSKLIKPKVYIPPPLGLAEFHKKRNTVLIWHEKGGLGDVYMQRMMLDDLKEIVPDCKIVFACLPEYFDAVKDHPAVSDLVDARTVNPKDYVVCYNTCVTIADRCENFYAPNCTEHRSDIWAKILGVTLKRHDMNIRLDPKVAARCRARMDEHRVGKPVVLLAPVSKMSTKSLLPWQMAAIKEATADCTLLGIHNHEVRELTELGVPGLYRSSIHEWMCYIDAADYVISVDTAAFHAAGGLKKPLLGIFTFADGKTYGKYFNFVLVQKHRDDGDWDCGPCFTFASCPKCNTLPKPCLTELSKELLQDGVRRMFERWPTDRRTLPILV